MIRRDIAAWTSSSQSGDDLDDVDPVRGELVRIGVRWIVDRRDEARAVERDPSISDPDLENGGDLAWAARAARESELPLTESQKMT